MLCLTSNVHTGALLVLCKHDFLADKDWAAGHTELSFQLRVSSDPILPVGRAHVPGAFFPLRK